MKRLFGGVPTENPPKTGCNLVISLVFFGSNVLERSGDAPLAH
jgi:hypothetical protein